MRRRVGRAGESSHQTNGSLRCYRPFPASSNGTTRNSSVSHASISNSAYDQHPEAASTLEADRRPHDVAGQALHRRLILWLHPDSVVGRVPSSRWKGMPGTQLCSRRTKLEPGTRSARPQGPADLEGRSVSFSSRVQPPRDTSACTCGCQQPPSQYPWFDGSGFLPVPPTQRPRARGCVHAEK